MLLRPPVRPMTARTALTLPAPEMAERFAFEPKFDGFRCLAFHHHGRVVLQSRQQRSLTPYFPEITAAVAEQLPEGTVIDGELVIRRQGLLDFTALQRRIHPSALHAARRGVTTPATLVVFDVLAIDGNDVRAEAYRKRRKKLRRLLDDAHPPLALMPMTRDLAGAQAWMGGNHDPGVEGVVVKDRSHGYRPGRRSWEKVRTRITTEAIVGGVIGSLDTPEVLILGRHDLQGRLRVAGRTSPLPAAVRREVGQALIAPVAAHPWPAVLPSSRFGQLPPRPVAYTPVEPLVVVEIDADTAMEQDRWRHARCSAGYAPTSGSTTSPPARPPDRM